MLIDNIITYLSTSENKNLLLILHTLASFSGSTASEYIRSDARTRTRSYARKKSQETQA